MRLLDFSPVTSLSSHLWFDVKWKKQSLDWLPWDLAQISLFLIEWSAITSSIFWLLHSNLYQQRFANFLPLFKRKWSQMNIAILHWWCSNHVVAQSRTKVGSLFLPRLLAMQFHLKMKNIWLACSLVLPLSSQCCHQVFIFKGNGWYKRRHQQTHTAACLAVDS